MKSQIDNMRNTLHVKLSAETQLIIDKYEKACEYCDILFYFIKKNQIIFNRDDLKNSLLEHNINTEDLDFKIEEIIRNNLVNGLNSIESDEYFYIDKSVRALVINMFFMREKNTKNMREINEL